MSNERPFFIVQRYLEVSTWDEKGQSETHKYRIVSVATMTGEKKNQPESIATGIPAPDLADVMCAAANEARRKK